MDHFYHPDAFELVLPSVFSIASMMPGLHHLFLCYSDGLPRLCELTFSYCWLLMATRGILLKPANETEYNLVTRGLLETNGAGAKKPILIFHWGSPRLDLTGTHHSTCHLKTFSTHFSLPNRKFWEGQSLFSPIVHCVPGTVPSTQPGAGGWCLVSQDGVLGVNGWGLWS